MHDLRFAIRQLLKSPGFTVVAVLTLALGLGANTVVFSWIRAILIDSVPGASAPHQLTVLCPKQPSGNLVDTMSLLDVRDLARETNVFAGVTGSSYHTAGLREGERTEPVWLECAMANFFDVLGVKPALGRFFLPEEDQHPGGDNVVVLEHTFWRQHFGADPAIVGRSLEIGGKPFTVVGVAPASFKGGMGGLRFDLWIPTTMNPEFTFPERAIPKRDWRSLHTYARLQPGVSLGQAQSAAAVVMQRLQKEYPATNKEIGVSVLPVWKSPWGGQAAFLPLLRSLAGVALLLLLLVIANIANLLLARAAARRQEVAVRLALGAGRGRLLRQLLTESLLLSALGGLLGCLLASWCVGLLFKMLPPTPLPIGYNVQLNGSVLLFSLVVTMVTGAAFGLAPAWQAQRTDLNETLKQGGRSGSAAGASHWLRGSLVVAEVALALVLLVGMALCARSLRNAGQVETGMDPNNVWAAGFRLPSNGYADDQGRLAYRRLREALRAIPGVESAALVDWLPLGFEGGAHADFSVDGYNRSPGEPMTAGVTPVSPDYFKTLRIPLVAGREFEERDEPDAPRVAIINQLIADRYFGGRNPVGLKIRFWKQEMTVVGVARTGKYRALNEPPLPFIYVAEAQFGDKSLAAVVRASGNPTALAREVERVAVAVDPNFKPIAALNMRDYTAAAFLIPKIAATLLTGLGLAALLLAALGIYGVMSYSVNQRTREIGVRMALGARTSHVLGQFVRQGMKLAAIGLGLGVVGALAVTRLLGSLLIGISAADPLTYLMVVAGLGGTTLLACWIPARRAARVDPMVALRYE